MDNGKEGFFSFLSKHHNAIVAFSAIGSLVVTFALAVFTYLSLAEVKDQREFIFKQFILSNKPNVNIGMKSPGLTIQKDFATVNWEVTNSGSDVGRITYRVILFETLGENIENFSITPIYARATTQYSLNKGIVTKLKNEINKSSTIEKINSLKSSNNNKLMLWAFLQADYDIPEHLTLHGNQINDKRSKILSWDRKVNRFENPTTFISEVVMNKIKEMNFEHLKNKG